jgi:hypothetical protein
MVEMREKMKIFPNIKEFTGVEADTWLTENTNAMRIAIMEDIR